MRNITLTKTTITMANDKTQLLVKLIENRREAAKKSLQRYEVAGFQSLSDSEQIDKSRLRFLVDNLDSLLADFEVIKNE